MIHSMSGGVMSEINFYDFAKIEVKDEGIFWYICDIAGIKEGQKVTIPFGRENKIVEGIVLRIDKNVSSQNAPISVKRAKKVLSILSK